MKWRIESAWIVLAQLVLTPCTACTHFAPAAELEVTARRHRHASAATPTQDAASLAPDAACPDSPRLHLQSVRSWPGGGVQIAAEPLVDEALGSELGLVGPEGTLPSTTLEAPIEAGVTVIVLIPSRGAEHRLRIDAARGLASALPASERIGLFVHERELQLLADVSADRSHLMRRLERLAEAEGETPPAEALNALRESLARLGGPWGAVSRFLVVVGGDAPPESVGGDHPVSSLWLGRTFEGPRSDVGTWNGRTPREASQALVEQIATRRARSIRLGACPNLHDGEPLQLELPDGGCEISISEELEHLTTVRCASEEAARDDYPWPARLDLLLSESQRATYDALWAARSEEPFHARLRPDSGDPVDVEAHFRGQTSLECQRKSLSLDLKGGALRRLTETGSSDEFYLISLCKDDGYFRQLFANSVMRGLGLFPFETRLVELAVNGTSQGLYLLLEKPTHALRQDHLATQAVVRRRFDADGKPPDVKLPKQEPERSDAQREYDALAEIAEAGPTATLLEDLRGRMDVDSYLQWLAANALLVNGDYADELYFFASREDGPSGRLYFRVAAWDLDDLGMPCHHEGSFSFDRGNGLMYCVEADLDRALLRADDVYAAYVRALSQLLNDSLTPERLNSLLNAARDELFARLNDDAICGAMFALVRENPQNATCDVMRASIAAKIEAYREQLLENHARLLGATSTQLERLP